ncbi:MAG TPA: thiamine phosphate synthase [Acidobacteriaceae bacterium]|jgi:thiamine-phosphate pyrophosphorylase|nr:thiamine phosphate synthase [Acidobacteriaceae bacterium]
MASPDAQLPIPDPRHLLPLLYPILDAGLVLREVPPGSRARRTLLHLLAHELADAGVTLLQYRNKQDSDDVFLEDTLALRGAAPAVRLILNDRPALVAGAGAHGVHVGQSDMPAAQVRALLGPDAHIGLSTNTPEEVRAGDRAPVDAMAIGPVFATASKSDTNPIVGLDGVRRARALTRKPLIAIGGITPANAAAVLAAGADSLAVISAIFGANRSPGEAARAFLAISK